MPNVTKKKNTNPNMIKNKELMIPVESVIANPNIMFRNTLDNCPWAKDKAQSLR